jgi:integrase
MLATEHGHRSGRGIEEKHVVLMRDRLQGTPGKANNLLTVLKRLLNYAIRPLKLRTDNPAAGVKLLAIGENEPWPERLLQTCLEVADPMMRLVIIQGACSGLRISDTIRVRHDWHDGRTMRARTKKTSQIVYIPMHPDWLAEIAKVPPVGPTILYNSLGKPWNDKSLQSRIRELMADPRVVAVRDELVQSGEIEEDMRFTHHGLRKNACCYLLECGLSDAAVGAILAMSPEMVRHYGKRVLNKQLAENAAKAINSNSVIPAAARGQTVER